jgi:hypothetical protein
MRSHNLSDFFKAIYFSFVATFSHEDKGQHLENARMSQTRLQSLSKREVEKTLGGAIWFRHMANEPIPVDAICTLEEFKEVFGSEPVVVPTTSGARLSNISQYRLAALVATHPQCTEYALHY